MSDLAKHLVMLGVGFVLIVLSLVMDKPEAFWLALVVVISGVGLLVIDYLDYKDDKEKLR